MPESMARMPMPESMARREPGKKRMPRPESMARRMPRLESMAKEQATSANIGRLPRPESSSKAASIGKSQMHMLSGTVLCHPHLLRACNMPENICDSCEEIGTSFRCTAGCDFDVCLSCWQKLAMNTVPCHPHPMGHDVRPTNLCDAPGCNKQGTCFRCIEGCDFDLCSDCWTGLSLGAVPVLNHESALAVVRREADLRRGENYLATAQPYVLRGEVPPVELDQQVQAAALQEAGFRPDPSTIRTYQALVRTLPTDIRKEVFFLSANDRFFHPEIEAVNLFFAGSLVSLDGTQSKFEDWLEQAKITGCSKLLVIASTSS
mmetsp:Transcript_11213/g.19683  ORF Transcript_11213/g.19683 Transcript_11213/m.19683 type:complete len:319 (-) Transcript_11213:455-1411(-)